MTGPGRRAFIRVSRALVAGLLAVIALSACEPTPGYLRRWANTEGSEDKFVEYLQNPDLSHEVHVTALELLLEQWDYSMSMLTGGEAVKGIEDRAERDAVLRDVTPHLRSLYDRGESWTHKMRDAAYHLRQATDNAEVRAGFDAILVDWLNNHWDPCRQGLGVVSTSQLLTVMGAEAATPKINEVVSEAANDRVLCFARDVPGLTWLYASDSTAQALTTRWEAGETPEGAQLKFEFFEFMLRFSDTPTMRTWLFDQLSGDSLEPLFKNAILDAVARNPSDEDIAGYTRLLGNETYARWAAAQAIINARGSEGLGHVLENLPADSEYGFYDGRVRPDGFRSAADNIFCKLTKLEELGDNARVVFEQHISDANVPAQLLSIACLAQYGDRQSVQRLTAASAAAPADAPAPGFGEGATVQSVIAETITAIQARIGG